jgi:hypothetical protein
MTALVLTVLLADTSTKNFEELLQTNVMGTYWGMKYAKTGRGNIVKVLVSKVFRSLLNIVLLSML